MAVKRCRRRGQADDGDALARLEEHHGSRHLCEIDLEPGPAPRRRRSAPNTRAGDVGDQREHVIPDRLDRPESWTFTCAATGPATLTISREQSRRCERSECNPRSYLGAHETQCRRRRRLDVACRRLESPRRVTTNGQPTILCDVNPAHPPRDAALVFIDKPSGLVVQRRMFARTSRACTTSWSGNSPAFLLQRLDRGTSRLISFSKRADVNAADRQFARRQIRKTYLAIST